MRRAAQVTFSFMFLSTGVGQKVTRMQLFEFLLSRGLLSQASTLNVRRQMVNFITSRIPDIQEDDINTKIALFSKKIPIRWKGSGRNKINFLKRNGDWLREEIYSSNVILTDKELHTPTGRKRPIKDFEKSNIRTKRRRTENLVASHSPEELAFATQTSFAKMGKRNVATVIKKATITSPRSLRTMKRIKSEKK